jgi:predicted lipid-binding transport protein (Tim44 family)
MAHNGSRLSRWGLLAIVLAMALSLNVSDALARAGGGIGLGSRGSRSFSAPPTTSTAPRPALPLDRSTAPLGNPSANPALLRPSAAGPGFFSRSNFGRGFLGGLLGAGLFGVLFGGGLFGGLGSITGLFGFVLQLLLLFGLARLALSFFSNRQRLAAGGPTGTVSAFNSMGDGASTAVNVRPIAVAALDFNAFEQLLIAIQAAFSEENVSRLRQLVTGEVVDVFAESLAANARRGVVNRLSSVRLLQGDLAEAWREAAFEYATVAMRFSLIDVEVERQSGSVIKGSPDRAVESTEIWTFCRPFGSGPESWKLSAIQHT